MKYEGLIEKIENLRGFFADENQKIASGSMIDLESHTIQKIEYEKTMKEFATHVKTANGKAMIASYSRKDEVFAAVQHLRDVLRENHARLNAKMKLSNMVARAVDSCVREASWNYAGDGNFANKESRVVLDYNV